MTADYNLIYDYFGGVTSIVQAPMYQSNSRLIHLPGTATIPKQDTSRECTYNMTKDGAFRVCTEFRYLPGSLTLIITLLPSLFTVSAFMGVNKASSMGFMYSVALGVLWVTLDIAGVWDASLTSTVIGHFVFWQAWCLLGISLNVCRYSPPEGNHHHCGVFMILLQVIVFPIVGILNIPGLISDADKHWAPGQHLLWIPGVMLGVGMFLARYKISSFKTLMTDFFIFTVLYALSPLLFLVIKFMAVLRPTNEFIINQSKAISMGEVIFESGPQVTLQIFIILQQA